MSNIVEFVSLEDRLDNLIEETKLKEIEKAKQKKQQNIVLILEEKYIVKSLIKQKEVVSKKMKNFFKVGVSAGIATLGLAQVAPAAAVVAAVAVGYSMYKADQKRKENKDIENDIKIAKRNVNTMLATLQGGKAGIYKITKRIAQCRNNLNIQDMTKNKSLLKYN
jgi:predicted O-methyltransferase YrrM